MLRIPLDTKGTAYLTQTVNVGGVSLSIRLLWNERDGAWYVDFESVNGKNAGVKVVPYSLLLDASNRVLSPGEGIVILKDELSSENEIDDSGNENVGFDKLGSVYGMYHVTEGDIMLMKAKGLL